MRLLFQNAPGTREKSDSRNRRASRFSKRMNNLSIKGNWNEAKGKLKQKYAQLTDDDLTFVEGKEDEMLGRLQQKLGRSKEEVQKEIADL